MNNTVKVVTNLVHTEFVRNAKKFPERVAISEASQQWSYGSVESASHSLEKQLRQEGVASGDIVVIDSDRSAMLVIAIIAVVRAGAMFLVRGEGEPIDYTAQALSEATHYHCISTNLEASRKTDIERAFDKKLKSFTSIRFNSNEFSAREEASIVIEQSCDEADRTMYLAGTSGSTGKAKLVVGGHRPLVHFVHWYCNTFNFDNSDRFSLLSGMGYDPMLRDIFTPLTLGACICIPDVKDLQDRNGVAKWLAREEVTVAHMTPTMANVVFAGQLESQVAKLRSIGLGGSVLSMDVVKNIIGMAPNAEVVNFYGTTETPQVMTYHRVDATTIDWSADRNTQVPLGLPIDDVEIFIRDDDGEPCKPGTVGEICVNTNFLSQGYFSHKEESVRSFIPNDTSESIFKEYLTADLGYINEDGFLEYSGRTNRQVKCRGYRVQPEELELAIRAYSDVKAVAVTTEPILNHDHRLVCYLELSNSTADVLKKIKSELLNKFPRHLCPEAFYVLESMPITANGKIDYGSLRKPREEIQTSVDGASSSKEQERVRRIWSEILDKAPDALSLNSNFFEAGGDSLSAGRLISELEKSFGKALRITDVFLYPSIKELSVFLSMNEVSDDHSSDIKRRSKSRLGRISAMRTRRTG